MKTYKVDKRGMIQTPGKFEGQMRYVPYFYEQMLNGAGDVGYFDNKRGECIIDILDEDREKFPELAGYNEISLIIDDFGFVTALLEPRDYDTEDYKNWRDSQ